jgi:uncharacterized coiled-coil DUF342 family protein
MAKGTPEKTIEEYQADAEQGQAQLDALNARVRELAGYQKEAVDGRDAIARLTAQVEELTLERDSTKKQLSETEGVIRHHASTPKK